MPRSMLSITNIVYPRQSAKWHSIRLFTRSYPPFTAYRLQRMTIAARTSPWRSQAKRLLISRQGVLGAATQRWTPEGRVFRPLVTPAGWLRRRES